MTVSRDTHDFLGSLSQIPELIDALLEMSEVVFEALDEKQPYSDTERLAMIRETQDTVARYACRVESPGDADWSGLGNADQV